MKLNMIDASDLKSIGAPREHNTGYVLCDIRKKTYDELNSEGYFDKNF